MFKRRLLLLPFLAAPAAGLFAGTSSRPLAEPPPLMQPLDTPADLWKKIEPLMVQGVQLHDQKRYDEAVEKYRAALAIDPDNTLAYYELAFSLSEKGDLRGGLAAAQAGLGKHRRHSASLYMMAGNLLDETGRAEEAVAAYEAGLSENPDDQMLHFNLGAAYQGQRQWRKARASLERSLMLGPDHPGSHLQLARVYLAEGGYEVPAFLAICRFLQLEPDSDRSMQALLLLDNLFRSRAVMGKDGTVNVLFSAAPGKTDEGDFSASEMSMNLLTAIRVDDVGHGMTPDPASSFRHFFSLLKMAVATPAGRKNEGFALRFYVPYFAALLEKNHFAALATLMLQRSGQQGIKEMRQQNAAAITALQAWSSRYRWSW